MQDVGQQGRTVLFVSHNMPAITRLCARAILLEGGRVRQDGLSPQVVSAYLNSEVGTTAAREWPDPAMAPGGEVARLRGVWVHTEEGQTTEAVDIRQPVGIEMQYDVRLSGYVLSSYFDFYVVAFHVIDSLEGDSAQGDWTGPWGRAVRPLLKWATHFTPQGTEEATL